MADEQKPMDIKHIKNLVSLMVENDLSRIEIEEGETRILLKRGQTPVITSVQAAPPAPAAATPTQAPAAAPAAPPPTESNEPLIRSPMVGTFYAAPDPDTPPFVNVGDVVQPDTVVCLVEAMKVFNEIKAEMAGRISRILVNNAEAVEYDQPLFAVEPV
jgi:acetyl-CoA carboxylase biotin carboxyl carrier protein